MHIEKGLMKELNKFLRLTNHKYILKLFLSKYD